MFYEAGLCNKEENILLYKKTHFSLGGKGGGLTCLLSLLGLGGVSRGGKGGALLSIYIGGG